ncbi:MAG: rod shape-determining protein MreD [Chloroflexi bacterium]|nr:MAG: rod shape-determining protein MreD [Chloroflexota bacterium]
MTNSIYGAIPLMLFLAVVQTAVLPFFPLFGLSPQLPFLVALAWALLRGMEEGIVWAFIGGLFLDLFSVTPLGVSSLSFMIGIAAVLWIQQAIPTSRFLLPVLLAVLSTVISLLVYFVILRALDYVTGYAGLPATLPLALFHALLILPVYWLAFAIDRRTRPRIVQL